MRKPAKALISYSHRDESHRQSLLSALSTAVRNQEVELWSDHCIVAGQSIDEEIVGQLKEADIVILLVSQDFIASDYCFRKELEIALERHANERCMVLPIVIRPTDLDGVPFQRIKMLPQDARPVTTWTNSDEAWLNVAKGIREAIRLLPLEADTEDVSEETKTTMRHRLMQSFEMLQARFENQIRPGIGFGFPNLDELIDGVCNGEVAVVASRPDHGNVELAMAAVINATIAEKKNVIVLSQRMTANQYSNRLMCACGFISNYRLKRGWLEDEDWSRVVSAIRILKEANLRIDDEAIRSGDELIEKLSSITRSSCDLLVIDGLEYIGNGASGRQRDIALSICDFSRRNDMPVLVTLSLGPGLESRIDRRPVVSDMEDWRPFELYSSKVLFCYREDLHRDESSKQNDVMTVFVAKSPEGILGRVDLRFYAEYGSVWSSESFQSGEIQPA